MSCKWSPPGDKLRLITLRYRVWNFEYELVRSPTLPQALPVSDLNPHTIAKLPLGFQDIARLSKLTTSMANLITRIVDSNDRYDGSVWRAPNTITETSLMGLTQTYPGLATPNDANGPALERLICLVLMRMRVDLVIVPTFRSPTCMSHSITLELTENISHRKISAENGERECLLWIWLMTLECWSVESSSAERWLRKIVLRFPEVTYWHLEGFKRLGDRFLWTPHLSSVLKYHQHII